MKSFSIGVIVYMILGIIWWGILLYNKNEAYFTEVLKDVPQQSREYKSVVEEQKRQAIMVIGEGFVLGLSLLAGIWIINRSAHKQIQAVNQQNNFLLSVSHELKSPIASIKLALQTLLKHHLSATNRTDLTHNAIKDAERLESLVQNILLTARIDNKGMDLFIEKVAVNETLRKIIRKFEENSQMVRINLKAHIPDQMRISADQLAIELAVSNLVDNAIKYSEPGDEVDVTCEQLDKEIFIKVRDHGVGIDEKDVPYIFHRFYRSDQPEVRARKGTGLGLYLSKQIVEAHRGMLELVSTLPSTGSTFMIKLPINGQP